MKKKIYRQLRYHGLTERAQYLLRRKPTLKIGAINLDCKVTPGDVMIDCGANVGDVTSLFARSCATVYAFEPNPTCFSILERRFKFMPSVRCFNQGVMDRNCRLTLTIPDAHDEWDHIDTTVAGSFLLQGDQPERYVIRQATCECIDLDEFIRALNCRVKLLKLDIEGSEIVVLNRLLETGTIHLVDLTVVETHERAMPALREATEALRARIKQEGLEEKIRLDWY